MQVTAFAEAGGGVAYAVGKGAVVEAEFVLAYLAEVAGLAHAPTHWILDRAPPIEAAIILTVLGATVVSDERRRALRRAEAVTDPINLPNTSSGAGDLGDVGNVYVVIGVHVTCLARMTAHLLICVLVVITGGTRTAGVAAVLPIVAHVALAEAVLTGAVVAAIIDAVVKVEVPHVITSD